MICCLASAACPLRDTAAPLAACGGREGIRAVYDAGIDLGHYGEVDQLAPAGAMAEFTAYVRRQSEEEAEAAFAPLRQAARSRGREREGAEVSFPLFPLREGRDRGHAATVQGSGA